MRGLCTHRTHRPLGIADKLTVNRGVKCQHGVSQAMCGRRVQAATSAGPPAAVLLVVGSLAVTPQLRLTVSARQAEREVTGSEARELCAFGGCRLVGSGGSRGGLMTEVYLLRRSHPTPILPVIHSCVAMATSASVEKLRFGSTNSKEF